MSDLLELVASFDRCEVAREQWNHRAHLVYALVKLLADPVAGGETIRGGILRYNAVEQIPQTPDGGYHESSTRFYIALVQHFIAETDVSRPLPQLVDELVLRYGARDLPYQYYSPDLLESARARTEWVEPDLLTLPQ